MPVIDGNGSELIFHGHLQPFTLDGCENITLRNFTIDWEKPIVSECRVIGKSCDYLDGYPLSLYRDVLRKIAGEEYRFTVIDGGKFGINASDPDFGTKHMKDGVHPDPVGQRIYADGVIAALTPDKQHRMVYDK